MKNLIWVIPLLAIILGVAIKWNIYKYNDCIAVGHTKGYCIGKIFLN